MLRNTTCVTHLQRVKHISHGCFYALGFDVLYRTKHPVAMVAYNLNAKAAVQESCFVGSFADVAVVVKRASFGFAVQGAAQVMVYVNNQHALCYTTWSYY